MKKILFVVFCVLCFSGIAFAGNDVNQSTTFGSNYNLEARGNGVNNFGVIGGSTTIEKGAITNTNENKNTNLNTNVNSNKNENTNVNINGGNRQGQSQINEGNTVTITNERPLLGYNTSNVPELNFGNGRLILDIAQSLPMFGIPLLSTKDTIKEVVDVTANITFKNLYKTILKMKKSQMPLVYNLKMQIVMVEGQKTWTTGGSLSGGGAGSFTQGGASAGASLVPQIGGTKAHPLFTVIFVKIN